MSTTKDYFDSIAHLYTSRSKGGLGKWLRSNELVHVKELLGSKPLGHVLELGSGSGYYSRVLNNLGCESLTCVDFSPQMLKNLWIPGCTKVEADIQEFRRECTYDTIFCGGVIEFLDPRAGPIIGIFYDACRVGIIAGKKTGAGRCAGRTRYMAIGEAGAFRYQPVQIGCVHEGKSEPRDGVVSLLVGDDENDIGARVTHCIAF